MAGYTTTALVVASLVTAAVGTGVSVYSSMQASENEKRIANYNAQIAQRQADIQGQVAQRQAEMAQYNAQLQMQQNAMERQMAEYQAQVSERNATTLRAYADTTEEQGREDARRLRLEKMRILGLQKNQYGKAGVAFEGSPLAVLAETDGMIELQIADSWLQTTSESAKMRGEADGLNWEAKVTRAGGEYQSLLADRAAQADYQNGLFEAQTASAGTRIAKRQADIERLAGNNRANAYQLQGLSSAISGASSMTGSLLSYGYGKSGTNKSTYPGGTFNANASVRRATAVG